MKSHFPFYIPLLKNKQNVTKKNNKTVLYCDYFDFSVAVLLFAVLFTNFCLWGMAVN